MSTRARIVGSACFIATAIVLLTFMLFIERKFRDIRDKMLSFFRQSSVKVPTPSRFNAACPSEGRKYSLIFA